MQRAADKTYKEFFDWENEWQKRMPFQGIYLWDTQEHKYDYTDIFTERELADISEAALEVQDKRMEQFFMRSRSFGKYRQVDFWEQIGKFLIRQKTVLSPMVYSCVYKEISYYMDSFEISAQEELEETLFEIYTICQDRITEERKRRLKLSYKSNRRQLYIRCLLLASFLVACLTVGQAIGGYPQNRKKEEIVHQQKEFAGYLNAKYDTDQYKAGDFKFKELKSKGLTDGHQVVEKTVGYRMTWKDGDGCAGYLFYDKDILVGYDNFEILDIEAALGAELRERTGYEQGIAFAGNSLFTANVSLLEEEDVVFHNRLEEDVMSFLEKEQASRRELYGNFFYSNYNIVSDAYNGALFFFYPDANIKTIRERLEMQEAHFDENLPKVLENFQKESKTEVFAFGMPQEYYDVFSKKQQEQPELAANLRGWIMYDTFEFPVNSAFVTAGYWEDSYQRFSSDGKPLDPTWCHARYASKADEGIFVLKENVSNYATWLETPSAVVVHVDKEGKSIGFHSDDARLANYIFVIDKEICTVGEDAVVLNGNFKEEYQEVPIEELTMTTEDNLVYKGKDLLIVDSYYDLTGNPYVYVNW